MSQVVLYGKWYSDCSARLRLALELKEINYEYMTVDDQNTAAYKAINPPGSIPTLVVQETQSSSSDEQTSSKPTVIRQSLAALEYLEERYPQSETRIGLLPPKTDPEKRATVRSLMNIIASDIHPLTTARVCRRICEQFPGPATETAASTGNFEWDTFWIRRGLTNYERVVNEINGTYSAGEYITLADVCLRLRYGLRGDLACCLMIFLLYVALSSPCIVLRLCLEPIGDASLTRPKSIGVWANLMNVSS